MGQGTVKLGSIYGIDIELHWSLLLLLLITTLLLAGGAPLPFLIIVLLFICVFLHELAHSVTSMKNGIKVREIVLNLIGGASIIDETKMGPAEEFNISIVGPITSLLLGGIFGVFVIFAPQGFPTLILQLLFELNMLLGVSNILPAFPMDGGRVMRSYLQKTRSRFDATMATVRISEYTIGLLVIGSFAYLLLTPYYFVYKEIDFFIFAFVAFFLYGGAQSEKQMALLRRDTSGLNISGAVSRNYLMTSSSATVEELYERMQKSKKHIFVIALPEGYAIVDLFRRRSEGAEHAGELAIKVETLSPETSALDALVKTESGAGVAVVARKAKPIGITTSQQLQALVYLHVMKKKKEKGLKG